MRKYRLKETTNLYHVSVDRHYGDIFIPRVPENRAIGEDETTPRICVSTSIQGGIRGACLDAYDCFVFIYKPVECGEGLISDNIFVPDADEVPDVYQTKEKWITCPVKMICVGYAELRPYIDRFGVDRSKLKITWKEYDD